MEGPASSLRDRGWIVFTAVAGSLTLFYFASDRPSWLFNVVAGLAVLTILLGALVNRPEHRAPWLLLALGQLLFLGGDIVSYNYESLFGSEAPFPSSADLLYLSVYPCLTLALVSMLRRRSPGGDRGLALDSLMVIIGLGTASWVFLISPYWHDGGAALESLVSIAYPAMDLVLVAVATPLVVGARKPPPAFRLLIGGILALLVTDAMYGWLLLHGTYAPGSGYLELGWAAFYVALGAAALHPSMRAMSDRSTASTHTFSWTRILAFGGAALIPPVIRLVQLIRGEQVDAGFISVATIVLVVVSLLRVAMLIREQVRLTTQQQTLLEAGRSLVASTTTAEIHVATRTSASHLAGSGSMVRICERGRRATGFVVVASSDEAPADGSFVTLEDLLGDAVDDGDGGFAVRACDDRVRGLLQLPATATEMFVGGVTVQGELSTLIVVAVPGSFAVGATEALGALLSQLALARESAAHTEDALRRQSEARFASLVRNSSDVVTVIEPDTTIRYVSPSSNRVLGYDPHVLEGHKLIELIHREDAARTAELITEEPSSQQSTLFEFRIKVASGDFVEVEALRTSLLHDENVEGIVLNIRDVSERKAYEERLARQAFHDSVTNLANRALFSDRVTHALDRQERDAPPIAILFIDLDDFKTINDSLGHAAGDQLLREVGDRLKECLRAADTAARLGGDEFAVLLEDGGEGLRAADVAERVLQALEAPFQLEGQEVFARASIGIAVAGTGADDAPMWTVEELFRNADVAMYMAKDKGKGRYQVFEPAMHDTALNRLELKAALQRALENDEFVLHYQPVVELATGRITGVEALVRWIHPERGLVPPLDFIPLAEETGLIVPIGRWVLREACHQAVEIRAMLPGSSDFHVAVNLSARQVARPEIVGEVREILAETGLPASSLILEITESIMMHDMELAIARLTELKQLGVKFAIDDFGTGYSSLNYVRRFPVDILKVDKSFIDGVAEGGESSALTAAVVELAAVLGLTAIAEGIERNVQAERLIEMGCPLGQGYLFSRPLGVEELHAHLSAVVREWPARASA